ncbi:MAG: hypothetical protein K2Q01_05450, partial [Rickettsiales bacterium]|nr:hypothetical protein [Rickettsiales bacterium]
MPAPSIILPTIACERAIDELRRQQGVRIVENGYAVGNFPAEFASEALLRTLQAQACQLLLTAPRARMLGLKNNGGGSTIKLDASSLTHAQILALADPTAPQASLPALTPLPATAVDEMALKLAKYASLLPALLLVPDSAAKDWLSLDASALAHYIAHPETEMIETASAHLPLAAAE